MTDRTCSVEGCGKAHAARGWCFMHYQRVRLYGDLNYSRPTAVDRFWVKVDKAPERNGCWVWTSTTNHRGYGLFRDVPGHRNQWTGPIGQLG